MSRPSAKFTFDTEFRADGDLISNAARARQKKAYTQEEIDTMFARARAEGIKSGTVRAQEVIAAATLELTAALGAAIAKVHADVEAVRAEAVAVALVAASKLARAAIAAAPHQEVELALREAIHQAIGEPRIVLKASAPVVAALEPAIAAVAHEEGFEGRIILAADPNAQGADCRIEWRGAGVEHSQDRIESALDELIARRFSQVPPKG